MAHTESTSTTESGLVGPAPYNFQHLHYPIQIGRRNNDHLEPMPLAFLGYTFGVINVQIDAKRRWVLRWPLPADDTLMPMLIHHSIDRNAEAAEPAVKVARGAIGGRVDPQLVAAGEELLHQFPRTVAEWFGIPPAAPPRDKPLRRHRWMADQRIIHIERDSHQHAPIAQRLNPAAGSCERCRISKKAYSRGRSSVERGSATPRMGCHQE